MNAPDKIKSIQIMNYGIYQSADKMAIDFIIIGSVILSTSFGIRILH